MQLFRQAFLVVVGLLGGHIDDFHAIVKISLVNLLDAVAALISPFEAPPL